MIIERIQQRLIIWIRWNHSERPADGKAEQCRHLVVDHRAAHRVELRCC